jgi:glutaminyl-tRNA synthetase
MSKRKILKLVEKNYVSGWDDPRLYTLVALRRRGIPPAAIVSFVGSLGVSTAITHIQTTRFEQSIRQHLENTAPRLAMVLHPLKVTLVNLPEDHRELIHKQLHPKFPELGYTDVPFTRTIYIDRDDFRAEATKDYFRLMPGQKVGLFHGPKTVTCITYESHTTNASTGEIDHLICNLEVPPPGAEVSKPKAFIQWVAEDTISESPVHVDETRIFHSLFNSDNPAGLDDYLQDLNPNSLEVVKGAVVEVGFWSLAKKATEDARREAMERLKDALKGEVEAEPKDKDTPKPTVEQLIGNEVVRFQGLRVAYFTLDKDSRLGCLAEDSSVTPGRRPGDKLILNRIVSLKEDSGKKSV